MTHIKKSIFNTTAKLRYCKLEYFGQSTKLKCRRIQKLFKKKQKQKTNAKLKCRENFLPYRSPQPTNSQ